MSGHLLLHCRRRPQTGRMFYSSWDARWAGGGGLDLSSLNTGRQVADGGRDMLDSRALLLPMTKPQVQVEDPPLPPRSSESSRPHREPSPLSEECRTQAPPISSVPPEGPPSSASHWLGAAGPGVRR